jgi:chromate transporter
MTQDSPHATVAPSPSELFFGFAMMAMQGFGGVLVFARRDIVERRRWMTADEFSEAFAFSQLLPGPNIVNLAVIFGQRHHGVAGAILAFLGILGPPCALVMVVGAIYAQFADVETLRRVLNGISVVASGLILSVVLKISMPLARQRSIRAGVIVAAVFVCAGILRLPLILVLAVSLPISIALAWLALRRAAAS